MVLELFNGMILNVDSLLLIETDTFVTLHRNETVIRVAAVNSKRQAEFTHISVRGP